MKGQKARVYFIVATLVALLGNAFFPKIPLLAYSPYLAYIFINKSLKSALWHCYFCGLIIDCTQSTLPFGFTSIAYCLVTVALYKQKWTIFDDNSLSLSIFSALFSLIFSALQLITMYFNKVPIRLSAKTVGSELIYMSLIDAMYAYLGFTLLDIVISYLKKNRFPFFIFKKL